MLIGQDQVDPTKRLLASVVAKTDILYETVPDHHRLIEEVVGEVLTVIEETCIQEGRRFSISRLPQEMQLTQNRWGHRPYQTADIGSPT